jgi:amidase
MRRPTVAFTAAAIRTRRSPPTAPWRAAERCRVHGVPFTVKDNIDLAGTPTAQGAKALANVYPSRDAPAVERLRAAGAIPIGRTKPDGERAASVPVARGASRCGRWKVDAALAGRGRHRGLRSRGAGVGPASTASFITSAVEVDQTAA